MTELIGKWVVHESVMKDRYVARNIIGETAAFWVTLPGVDGAEPRKRKKKSIGILAVYDDQQTAERCAKAITERLLRLRDDYNQSVRKEIDAFRNFDEEKP